MVIMKKLFNYISLLGVALAFSACESDLDGTTYTTDNASAPVLSALSETNYVLESRNSENLAFKLQWQAPSFGYNAIVTSSIQLDLATSTDYATAYTLAAVTTATSQEITVGALNTAVLSVLRSNGLEEDLSARDYKIRISSSIASTVEALNSNELTLSITPYSADIQYPEMFIIGGYCNWSGADAKTQNLFSFSEDEINYEGLIDFGEGAANGFKLTDVAPSSDWSNCEYNCGVDGSTSAPEGEATSIQLINDGGSGNISCYSHRFYRFTFSKSDLILHMNLSFDNLYLVGSDAGIGWSTDTGKPMSFDTEKQRFYLDYTFAADSEIKFLTSSNLWLGDAGDGKLGDGGNIIVPAGSYRIYVNLNSSSNQTYELNADDYNK